MSTVKDIWDSFGDSPTSDYSPEEPSDIETYEKGLTQGIHRVHFWLKDIVRLWKGTCLRSHRTLSPDVFEHIWELAEKINYEIDDCRELIQIFHASDMSPAADHYEEMLFEPAWEMAVLSNICNSYAQSANIELAEREFDPSKFSGRIDIECKMLEPVLVTPWNPPPCPDLEIPNKPAVVLEVVELYEDGTIDVGYQDPFVSTTVATCIDVDETVAIGDKVVIRCGVLQASAFGMALTQVEYDGLAEPECPVSSASELEELDYTFDYVLERQAQLKAHRDQWIRSLWSVMSISDINRLATEYDNPQVYGRTKRDKYGYGPDYNKYEVVEDCNGYYRVKNRKDEYDTQIYSKLNEAEDMIHYVETAKKYNKI